MTDQYPPRSAQHPSGGAAAAAAACLMVVACATRDHHMTYKSAPPFDARYWSAILLASMCGTNLGDLFPKLLHIGPGSELFILTAIFAGLLALDRVVAKGVEALYWLTILVVRAAATAIADFTIDKARVGYVAGATDIAAILVILLLLHRRPQPGSRTTAAGGMFWPTMLAAGTLGTVIGDGLGHSFPSVTIGVPASAALATVALALILWLRAHRKWALGVSYWVAIVAVRWWGTNLGDILAHVTSLAASLGVTSVAMTALLYFWRRRSPPARPAIAFAGQA